MLPGVDGDPCEWKESQIKIGAQAYLEKFYQSLGFEPVSEVYLEDDIQHLDMLYNQTSRLGLV